MMTSGVYVHVIEDVISKVRAEFLEINDGPGEAVLNQLQGLWEMKMMQVGAIFGPIQKKPVSVHDLNVPYEGPEEYETPTAEMLFPPTPSIQTPFSGQTPLPGTAQTPIAGESSSYNIRTAGTPITPNEFSSTADPLVLQKIKSGRPNPYMQPPAPWMNQGRSVDVNVAYDEGREDVGRGISQQSTTQDLFTLSGKRKRDNYAPQYYNGRFIPQQDGADGSVSNGYQIPQLDGPISDPYEDLSTPNIYNYQGVANEDYNVASTPAPQEHASTPAVSAHNDVGEDDEEKPLNEDDDDDDFDDVVDGDDLDTKHLILAQFEKVSRTKNKWKCILKDGIMHINNKDILFNKATGEFDF